MAHESVFICEEDENSACHCDGIERRRHGGCYSIEVSDCLYLMRDEETGTLRMPIGLRLEWIEFNYGDHYWDSHKKEQFVFFFTIDYGSGVISKESELISNVPLDCDVYHVKISAPFFGISAEAYYHKSDFEDHCKLNKWECHVPLSPIEHAAREKKGKLM